MLNNDNSLTKPLMDSSSDSVSSFNLSPSAKATNGQVAPNNFPRNGSDSANSQKVKLLRANSSVPADSGSTADYSSMDDIPHPITSPAPNSRGPPLYSNDDVPSEDYLRVKSMVGLNWSLRNEVLYWLACVCSGFLFWLLSVWFPHKLNVLRYVRVPLDRCQYVLILGEVHDPEIVPVKSLDQFGQEISGSSSRRGRSTSHVNSNGYLYHPNQTSDAWAPTDSNDTMRQLCWRHNIYIFNSASQKFEMVKSDLPSNNSSAYSDERIAGSKHTSISYYTPKDLRLLFSRGLSTVQITENHALYGVNALLIKIPTILSLLFQEVFHPFNVFQMYSIILWFFEDYEYFAICITIVASVSIIQTLYETRTRMADLARLAKFECEIKVLRHEVGADGQAFPATWNTVSSLDLVPGDIVEIATGVQPCDFCLLDGGCVVNESMLTGESVPVLKSSILWPAESSSAYATQLQALGTDAKNTIFSATKILQLKPRVPDTPVVAVVVRTGFATTQGSLILSILFPKPSQFKFITQSYYFIFSMFIMSLVGFALTIWQGYFVYGGAASDMIMHGLDLITIVVPPSLPLALSVGTNFALMWLKEKKIFCISPARINMAGKVRLMCFDKTGTLTAESLEFKGVLPARLGLPNIPIEFGRFQSSKYEASKGQVAVEASTDMTTFSFAENLLDSASPDHVEDVEPIQAVSRRGSVGSIQITLDHRGVEEMAINTAPAESAPISYDLKCAMACCQSLALLDQNLIGDPLEVQTFEASSATLLDYGDLGEYIQLVTVNHHSNHQESIYNNSPPIPDVTKYGILIQFEFSSKLQRMSVLAQDTSTKAIHAYVKGSPEMIGSLSIPSTLPSNYARVLGYFARQGFRIIAIGRKPFQNYTVDELRAQNRESLRVEVEKDLEFLGLILLENLVKEESAPTLRTLKRAGIRCVMVTGDNALTAVTVAKECQLVDPNVRVFQSQFVDGSNSKEVEWVDTNDDTIKLNPVTLELPAGLLEDGHSQGSAQVPYELAVTGSVYAHLKNQPDAEKPYSFFHRVVINSQIFARMTPDQKADLVTEYMGMNLFSGMCGDGANDCAALKAAHIGVSLSESEASIAAPFTYQKPNISCIPILLCEGRSSLATSFQLFRYMCLYSGIQFCAALCTYFMNAQLGNWQYFYQDMWVVFPMVIFIGATHASTKLGLKRPSGNLTSMSNILNLAVHVGLACFFQGIVLSILINQSDINDLAISLGTSTTYGNWTDQCLATDDLSNPVPTPNPCFTPTIVYYMSNLEYIFVAIPFALGRPWKTWFFLDNWKLCGWIAVTIFSSYAMTLLTDQPGFFRMNDAPLPNNYRHIIFWFSLLYFASVIAFDVFMSPALVKTLKRFRSTLRPGCTLGTAYHRKKIVDSPSNTLLTDTAKGKVKEWWILRGQFESQFSVESNKYANQYNTLDGSKIVC